jgi:hypothetical protein
MREPENRMRWLLMQVCHALPKNRDWLDPEIEAEAKAFGAGWKPDALSVAPYDSWQDATHVKTEQPE